MPRFKRPELPHPLIPLYEKKAAEILSEIEERIQQEFEILEEFNIPLPDEKKPPHTTIDPCEKDWYKFARWSWLRQKYHDRYEIRFNVWYPQYATPFYICHEVSPGINYFLVSDEDVSDEDIEEARELLKEKGIEYVAEKWPGQYYNRNPYQLFISFVRTRLLNTVLSNSGWLAPPLRLYSVELKSVSYSLPKPEIPSGMIVGLEFFDPTKHVLLNDNARDRHCYVIGRTGTGKSTLLLNLARQDIEQGRGVAVIDPHGDLTQSLLNYIPEARIGDTIYFDAGDEEHPIALNIMNAQSEPEISRLTDDLLVTFRRLSESWGDKMEHILGYAFETLLRTPEASFIDLKTLLTDPAARSRIVSKLTQPDLINFWQHEFAGLKTETQPVLTRLSKFTRSSFIYAMLSQATSPLDFYELIQNKKILLVNLASGIIGETSAGLLGSLIVSQLQLAVMRRARLPQDERSPFYLYVDEFQNFTNSAFEKILSEARKYNLCLTLAHQFISQLSETQRDAIFGNVGTKIMFGVADKDASALRYQIGGYEPTTLINLPQFTAIYKTQAGEQKTTKIKTLPAPKPDKSFAQAIIEHTRQTYSASAAPPVKAPAPERPQPTPAASPFALPAAAQPKEFPTVQDKILFYVSQAEYLSTAQIIELCFSHYKTEGSKKANASRALNELVENKKLSAKFHNRKQIYFIGKNPNQTDHNLAVRDLYTKIILSGFEVADVQFNLSLGGTLNPDLAVSFRAQDGGQLQTYWEYDAGSEGLEVLRSKVQRYRAYAGSSRICFVFATLKRLQQAKQDFGADFITYAVLGEFKSLNDSVFRRGESETGEPYFIKTPYDNSHNAISINT